MTDSPRTYRGQSQSLAINTKAGLMGATSALTWELTRPNYATVQPRGKKNSKPVGTMVAK